MFAQFEPARKYQYGAVEGTTIKIRNFPFFFAINALTAQPNPCITDMPAKERDATQTHEIFILLSI